MFCDCFSHRFGISFFRVSPTLAQSLFLFLETMGCFSSIFIAFMLSQFNFSPASDFIVAYTGFNCSAQIDAMRIPNSITSSIEEPITLSVLRSIPILLT